MESQAATTSVGITDSTLRRPMNAFLLFCKRHRSLVKGDHPWLDNRSCTKKLADMWAVLDGEEKSKYLQLARECKVAFMKAHPDYKWCGSNKQNVKSTSPAMRTRTAPTKRRSLPSTPTEGGSLPTKISQDPVNMGGLSLLLLAGEQTLVKPNAADMSQLSPKSRLFEFAEMCSDQLGIECQTAIKQETKPPTKNCRIENNPSLPTQQRLNKSIRSKCASTTAGTSTKARRHTRQKRKAKSGHPKDVSSTKGNDDIPLTSFERRDSVGWSEGSKDAPVSRLSLQEASTVSESQTSGGGGDSSVGDRCSRRASSRSCKGRLYREFVMEGMLESLQRPDRPFNTKRTWRHLVDGGSLSDGDHTVFDPGTNKPRCNGRRKGRKRTAIVCGQPASSPVDFDYGEINVEARLASMPQHSPEQFGPKSKCHRLKKSTCLYKNSTFLRKEERTKHQNRMCVDYAMKMHVAGSCKRKAPKSTIQHLTSPRSEASAARAPSRVSSIVGPFVVENHPKTHEAMTVTTPKPPPTSPRPDTADASPCIPAVSHHSSTISLDSFTRPLMRDTHQLPMTSCVSSAASKVHRSILTVN